MRDDVTAVATPRGRREQSGVRVVELEPREHALAYVAARRRELRLELVELLERKAGVR